MREKEREGAHERASEPTDRDLPSPKPLGSIYSGGGEACFHFIPLVGWDITSKFSKLYNMVLETVIRSLYQ
jgi:hypothetical protein